MRAPLVLALAALTLAPAALAGWTQAGGGPAHDGRAALGDLDVVAQLPLLPQGWQPADAADPAASLVLETAAGVLALGRDGTACRLALMDVAGPDPAAYAPRPASGPIPCPLGARLVGWDAGAGRALVCVDGVQTAPLLQSWPLDGAAAAWTRAPQADAPDPLALVPASGEAGIWSCRAPALDAGSIVVAFSSAEGRNRVESLALADGQVQWSATVPSSVFLSAPPQAPSTPVGLPGPVQDATGAFAIRSVVLTTTGVVVAGRLDGTNAADAPPGLAWFGHDGMLRGAYSLSPGADPTAATAQTLLATSRASAANGRLAAHLVGSDLFVVDPTNAQGTLTPLGTPSLGQAELASPCWARDTLVVPGEAAAFLVPATDPSALVTWPGFGGGRLQACAVTPTSLWAAVTRSDNGTRTDLLEASLLSARSLRRIPLPLAPADPAALTVLLLPLDDGRLLATAGSDAVLLAPLPATGVAAPTIKAESRYPNADQPATVTVDQPAGASNGTRLLLAWGDGLLEEVAPGRHSHTYGEGGDRVVRLTAVAPDNRTATRTQVLHVGAAAPEPRNFFQWAFAAENQNYTFTVIGLLVTFGGAAIAAAGVARGRNRLGRHLAALDRIRDDGRREPFVAIRELHGFREERRRDLGRGRLEDAQYVVLESAATEVLHLLRQRILGTYVGRVSDRFSHALDLALADGDIDDAEGQGLLGLAGHEADLTAPERDRLAGLVRSWQRVI